MEKSRRLERGLLMVVMSWVVEERCRGEDGRCRGQSRSGVEARMADGRETDQVLKMLTKECVLKWQKPLWPTGRHIGQTTSPSGLGHRNVGTRH